LKGTRPVDSSTDSRYASPTH